MKAKEYLEKYKEDAEIHWRVCNDMFFETSDLIKSRRAQTDAALIAIIEEQHRKWKAFLRMCPKEGIREHAFIRLCVYRLPELRRYFPACDFSDMPPSPTDSPTPSPACRASKHAEKQGLGRL